MSRKLKKRTVNQVVDAARRVAPRPFWLSWSWTQKAAIGGACTAACRQGLLRQVAGPPGADWFELPTATLSGISVAVDPARGPDDKSITVVDIRGDSPRILGTFSETDVADFPRQMERLIGDYGKPLEVDLWWLYYYVTTERHDWWLNPLTGRPTAPFDYGRMVRFAANLRRTMRGLLSCTAQRQEALRVVEDDRLWEWDDARIERRFPGYLDVVRFVARRQAPPTDDLPIVDIGGASRSLSSSPSEPGVLPEGHIAVEKKSV